ncbi:MAG: hypothetical protein A2144_08545 [Chloroflexi bacterium RBG_16_50_9]|nr:MAG: hypothetical protein A2144_08545 [Chloroflexi bacterium RBG_16_50_9]
MSDETRGSFIRWQGITIQQLYFVNNLIIGLSAGILAFQFNIAFNKDVVFNCTSKWLFSFSIAFIFVSLFLGCLTAWNRLDDFRTTEKIARKRGKHDFKDSKEIENLRDKAKQLGKRTWCLLKLQLFFFCVGAILIPPLAILRVIG